MSMKNKRRMKGKEQIKKIKRKKRWACRKLMGGEEVTRMVLYLCVTPFFLFLPFLVFL
jgi:hypothetical protein